MDFAEEVKSMDPYACYTKAVLSKAGGLRSAGGLSSPSTTTPLSSTRSICSPYTDAGRLADVEVASEDSEHAFEVPPGVLTTQANHSPNSEPMGRTGVCRFPMPKRLARQLPSSENLPLADFRYEVSPSSETTGIMSASSVFSSLWPFGKQDAPRPPTGYTDDSSTAGVQEEIASGEFSFFQVAAHDFTILHVMKEEPEEEDDTEPKQLIPFMAEPSLFLTQPRPCSWPVCPPRERRSPKPVSSASDLSQATVDMADSLPVRNTFVHFKTEFGSGSFELPTSENRWSSAPGALLSREWSTKYPEMEVLHARGECRPCAYVYHKEDGCRWGGACNFCHLCPPGAMKKRKKEKIRHLRELEAAEKAVSASCASSEMGGN